MTMYERLLLLDRRWIFLVLAVVIIIGMFVPMNIPTTPASEVKVIYDYIESLKEGDYILVAMDYDPNAMAELHPVAYAVLEQAFTKKLKVITLTLSQNGAGMVDEALDNVIDSTRIYRNLVPEYGQDFVFLGYRPYFSLVILGMGQNFRVNFSSDYNNTPLDSIPMMKGIQNYDDVKCVISISGGNVADAWVANANGRYNVKVALATTGVMAADYYPYYQSEQIFGIIGGMKGAAEYEYLAHNPGPAIEAMKVQIFAHIVIIAFIVLGNIGFFMDRRAKRKAGRI
ncbi:MAG: hypothetical protein WBP42_08735 [Candidatus Zixiibacteriota bacterium]